MGNPLGWVVIARECTGRDVEIEAILSDCKLAKNESAAVEIVKAKVCDKHPDRKFAAFAIMWKEQDTKHNLETALHRLGIRGMDLDYAYSVVLRNAGGSLVFH